MLRASARNGVCAWSRPGKRPGEHHFPIGTKPPNPIRNPGSRGGFELDRSIFPMCAGAIPTPRGDSPHPRALESGQWAPTAPGIGWVSGDFVPIGIVFSGDRGWAGAADRAAPNMSIN